MEIMTVAQVATFLQAHPDTVYRLFVTVHLYAA